MPSSIRKLLHGSEEDSLSELRRLTDFDGLFWDSLEDESDRGLVLASGAYFERVLEDFLASYFDNCGATAELISANSGLGTFRARVLCCRSLRLINDWEFQQLELIRRVRNAIAHDLTKNFESDDVKDRVSALENIYFQDDREFEKKASEGPRAAFSLCCFALAIDLQRRELSIQVHTRDYPEQIPYYWEREDWEGNDN